MSKQIKKIEKILSDTDKSSIHEFDIVFLIDSTASMGPYIEAAKSESKNISKILRNTYPEMNFQYGYIFYRDPIDAKDDIHEMINLTDQVNDLPSEIGKIRAIGGGDLPEDWVGAYKKVNNDINWRNGNKVIFHIADAGAHGKRFTPSDKYPDEEKKLIKEIEKCCSKNIKIFAFVIEEDSRNSFIECKKIYKSKGGTYEIYNFEKPKNIGYNEYNLFCSSKTNSLFGCYENSSSGLFGNNNEENKNSIGSLFGTKNESNTNSTSLFANNNENKNIFVNDTGGFFANNKNTSPNLFFTNNNENNILSNNTGGLFGNNKNSSPNLFFTNNNENNNIFANNTGGLFGNNENNNNSNSLFANKNENNNPVGLFGTNKNNNNSKSLFTNNNENNNLFTNNPVGSFDNNNNLNIPQSNSMNNENSNFEMNFQSQINSNFRNLVVNSVRNIQSNKF